MRRSSQPSQDTYTPRRSGHAPGRRGVSRLVLLLALLAGRALAAEPVLVVPEGALGGSVPVRVRVPGRADAGQVTLSAREETAPHPCDWTRIPGVVESADADGTVLRFDWKTTERHNASHTLRAEWTAPGGEASAAERSVEVRNLAIASVQPRDYVVLHGGKPAALVVEIEDNDPSAPMDVALDILTTEPEHKRIRTLSRHGATGRYHVFTWDGTDADGRREKDGVYTFDVTVRQPADHDEAAYRSRTLRVLETSSDWMTVKPPPRFAGLLGEGITGTGGHDNLTLTYRLSAEPSLVHVETLGWGPLLTDAVVLTDRERTKQNPVIVHVPGGDTQTDFGVWVLLCPWDRGAATDRSHRDRPALPVS